MHDWCYRSMDKEGVKEYVITRRRRLRSWISNKEFGGMEMTA